MKSEYESTFMSPHLTPMQQRIIKAAIDLLDKEGLENVSLRKLAKTLNIQAPALYWHFKNKETLIDFMAEAILREQLSDLQPRIAADPWQTWLTNTMHSLRKAMLAHPDGARVVAGAHFYPAVTLGKMSEYGLQSLRSAGLDLQVARRILMTATHYTFGSVIEEQASPTPEEVKDNDIKKIAKFYPTVVVAMLATQKSQLTNEEDFDIGLQYIIKGSSGKQ